MTKKAAHLNRIAITGCGHFGATAWKRPLNCRSKTRLLTGLLASADLLKKTLIELNNKAALTAN